PEREVAAEGPVRSGRADERAPVDVLRLAREEPRAAHAVAADVHQRPALDVRTEPDVVLVVERVAERRADEAELADRALGNERRELRRLRIVPVHEGLREQEAGALRRV